VYNNLTTILRKNDRIQLKLNYNIFLLNRFNFTITIKKHYQTLIYYKRYLKNNTLTFNKKIFLNFTNNFFDIFKFIEIDYIILTVFIIYLPFTKIDYNFFNLYYKSIYKLNLLN
jgi:hypothetical protein